MMSMWSKCGGSYRRSCTVPPLRGTWARAIGGRAAVARTAPPRASIRRRVRAMELSLSACAGAQLFSQDLADRALGQRVEEADLLRTLVAGQALGAERHELFGR